MPPRCSPFTSPRQESYEHVGGKSALSQYYSNDGSYEWSPCTILTFDSRKELFRIRWTQTRKQKWVSRLNLRLENEDLATWIRKTKLIKILQRDRSRFETRNKWMSEALPTLGETTSAARSSCAAAKTVLNSTRTGLLRPWVRSRDCSSAWYATGKLKPQLQLSGTSFVETVAQSRRT